MKQLVRPQQTVWLGLIMLLGMLVWPHVALADAPVTRGLQRTSVGSVDHSMLWSDIQPMPPLDKMLRPAESEVARPGAAPGQTFTLPAPGYQDTAVGLSDRL